MVHYGVSETTFVFSVAYFKDILGFYLEKCDLVSLKILKDRLVKLSI